MDTDKNGAVVKETDRRNGRDLVVDTWQEQAVRTCRMCCLHCHTPNYVTAFYKQYDDFVVNFNQKFAKPGTKIMTALLG